MNFLGFILYLISLLPFWVMHRLSDFMYFWIYYVFGYRKKVVWENLKGSFPEKTDSEILQIHKKFYQNFCDLIFETIKTFSITEAEIQERCPMENPEILQKPFDEKVNIVGISGHMCNWEWMSLSLSYALKNRHELLAVYAPLANKKLNDMVVGSRERFGANFVAIKNVKSALDQAKDHPHFLALLSDQAPRDFSKAFELPFLNRSTFFLPGPGILSEQRNMIPMYGWVKRLGRSRYVWRLEHLDEEIPAMDSLTEHERGQVRKISVAHLMSEESSLRALVVVRKFARGLDAEIKKAPADWLWSHRRWKSR